MALGAVSAHAVELQQKWQAGQKLDYDLALVGTANLKVPADAKIFFAGLPLEIEMQGKGLGRLNTVSVDALGTGTVLFELPRFDLNARAFGQKGLVELRDGQTRFLLNGKPLALDGKNSSIKMPANRYGLVIGKDGRIKNVKTLDPLKPTVAPSRTPQLRQIADTPVAVDPAKAIDRGALISSMILRALPTLWPQGDVKLGDTWKTELAFPGALAKNPAAAVDAPPLSQWTMTLKGQETVDGVELWRVGVVGEVRVEGERLAAPATPKKDAAPVPQLDNLSQTVNGDLWFDAARGHVARGEFVVDARGQSRTLDSRGKQGDPAWADFTGTFGMKLRDANAR